MKIKVWFLRPDYSDLFSIIAGLYLLLRHPDKPLYSHVVMTLHDCKHTWVAEYGAFGMYIEQLDATDIKFARSGLVVEFDVTRNELISKLQTLELIRHILGNRKLTLLDFITNAPICTTLASTLFKVQDYGRWLTPVRLAEELIDLGGEPYETP